MDFSENKHLFKNDTPSTVGPQVKPIPELDIFVGAIMGKIIVLELPGPCRGDLKRFSENFRITCLHKIIKHGLKWVAVSRHGLILWENDATGF